MFVGDAHHVARVFRGKVEDRLTQANEEVLRLTLNQLPADQLAGLFLGLRLGQECLGSEFGVPHFQVIFRKLADPLASDFAGLALGPESRFGALYLRWRFSNHNRLSVVETKSLSGPRRCADSATKQETLRGQANISIHHVT